MASSSEPIVFWIRCHDIPAPFQYLAVLFSIRRRSPSVMIPTGGYPLSTTAVIPSLLAVISTITSFSVTGFLYPAGFIIRIQIRYPEICALPRAAGVGTTPKSRRTGNHSVPSGRWPGHRPLRAGRWWSWWGPGCWDNFLFCAGYSAR